MLLVERENDDQDALKFRYIEGCMYSKIYKTHLI